MPLIKIYNWAKFKYIYYLQFIYLLYKNKNYF